MEAKKFDSDKPPMGLVPGIAIREISKAFEFGLKKYGRYNWLKGMKWSRIYDAALRHLYDWIDGDEYDEESGLSHLSHLGCCVMFLIVYEKLGLGEDDRYIITKPINPVPINVEVKVSEDLDVSEKIVELCKSMDDMNNSVYTENKISREDQILDTMKRYECTEERAIAMIDLAK